MIGGEVIGYIWVLQFEMYFFEKDVIMALYCITRLLLVICTARYECVL